MVRTREEIVFTDDEDSKATRCRNRTIRNFLNVLEAYFDHQTRPLLHIRKVYLDTTNEMADELRDIYKETKGENDKE